MAVRERLIEIALTMPLAPADSDLHSDVRYVERMLRQIKYHPCIALPSLEEPVLLCGIVHEMGIGEAWMLTGLDFQQRWRTVLRQHRQVCADIYRACDLHRMHMMVDPARPEASAYARAIGFEYEFTARRFSPQGVDMSFYVWPHQERKNNE